MVFRPPGPFPAPGEHVLRPVGAYDVHAPAGQLQGQAAGAAGQIQQGFRRLSVQSEQVQEIGGGASA